MRSSGPKGCTLRTLNKRHACDAVVAAFKMAVEDNKGLATCFRIKHHDVYTLLSNSH